METNTFSPCDYVTGAKDNHPRQLTRAILDSLLDSKDVRGNVEKVHEHKPDAEIYKQKLPGISWQSKFGGALRVAANAQSTGFFCIDVDIHHEDHFKELLQTKGTDAAYQWAEAEARERAMRWKAMAEAELSTPAELGGELDIVAIHISPSGTGVHVVALAQPYCNSIAEDQERLAKLLGTSYDKVCHDTSRIFFVTPREDWLYLDYKTLFQEEEETPLPTSPEGEGLCAAEIKS